MRTLYGQIAGWLIENWPDMATLVLILVGVLVAMFPGKVSKMEGTKRWRFGVSIILILIGTTGFWQGLRQKHDLQSQITTLTSAAAIEATKDDLKQLATHLDDGFTRVVNALGILSKTPKQPVITPSLPPQSAAPTVEHTRFTWRVVPSDKPEFPYALQVIIQSDVTIEPVSFAVECTGPVEEVRSFIAGQGAYFNVFNVPSEQNKNVGIVHFTFPPLKPETPLVVTLLSKQDIRVKSISKLQQ